MNNRLKEVIKLFARLGIFAFGGPAAHIVMMRHEVVAKKQWMDDEKFIDLMGATNLIPGPNSTELAIHLGKEKAGWKGLFAAGAFFILPAVIITGFIAWLYKEYGSLPQFEVFTYGIKPAVIAIIVMAVYPLLKVSVKNVYLAVIGIVAFALAMAGLHEIIVMFGAGLLYMLYRLLLKRQDRVNSLAPFLAATVSNGSLFLVFLKIGAILYGSGYVLFAFIDTELVAKGILSRKELMDAIAVGQFTPGPVFSSVTFIGYQINGFMGALAATAGVFLPSFVFVALLNRVVTKIRGSKVFSSFLDAVNVASVAVIAAVCLQMGQESIMGWQTALICLLSFLLLLFFRKMNSAFIVVFGSLTGYIFTLI